MGAVPSWGYGDEQGYTTFHESWNSGVSRNHIMFGEICALKVNVVIPPNTSASLYLPAGGKLYEAGKLLKSSTEFISGVINDTGRILSLQSGDYNFELKN